MLETESQCRPSLLETKSQCRPTLEAPLPEAPPLPSGSQGLPASLTCDLCQKKGRIPAHGHIIGAQYVFLELTKRCHLSILGSQITLSLS